MLAFGGEAQRKQEMLSLERCLELNWTREFDVQCQV